MNIVPSKCKDCAFGWICDGLYKGMISRLMCKERISKEEYIEKLNMSPDFRTFRELLQSRR